MVEKTTSVHILFIRENSPNLATPLRLEGPTKIIVGKTGESGRTTDSEDIACRQLKLVSYCYVTHGTPCDLDRRRVPKNQTPDFPKYLIKQKLAVW